MIAEPRSLPGTATAREAGEVLTPAEVRAVYVVGDDGALVGVVTRKTLVAKVVARGLDPNAVARGGDRREAVLHDRRRHAARRGVPLPRGGGRRAGPGRPRRPARRRRLSRRCSSGASPRTRSLRSPSSTPERSAQARTTSGRRESTPTGAVMERRSAARRRGSRAGRRRRGRCHRLVPSPAPTHPRGHGRYPPRCAVSVPKACRSPHRRLPLSGPAPVSLRGRLRGSSRGGCP